MAFYLRELATIAIFVLGCDTRTPAPKPAQPQEPARPSVTTKPPESEPVANPQPSVTDCGPSTVGPLQPGGAVRYGKQPTTPGTTGIPGRIYPRGKLVHGQATIRGGYDAAVVRRYLRRRDQNYRWCYEKELVQNSDLAGQVILRFTIDSDGKVTRACARGITSSIEACMAEQTRTIELPAPNDGKASDVMYPLDLTSEWPAPS